jgi:hypothetical protein
MTTIHPRPLSVAEMQAALDAAWRGDFAHPDRGKVTETGTSSAGEATGTSTVARTGAGGRSASIADAAGGRRTTTSPHTTALTGPAVLVLAGHAGAGASTVALLLGEAAATAGTATRLVECADPTRSGIAAATDIELGEDPFGWRLGRRGDFVVERPARRVANVEDVAPPAPVSTGGSLTVVDAGWSAWDVLASASWVTGLLHTAQVVVVCRVTVPGVRQTEQLLAALPGRDPLVAAVGLAKWPGVVSASCGPLLRAARDANRIVPVPLDRQLDVTGLTAGRLPKQLTGAGRSLAGRVLTDLPAPTTRQRRSG